MVSNGGGEPDPRSASAPLDLGAAAGPTAEGQMVELAGSVARFGRRHPTPTRVAVIVALSVAGAAGVLALVQAQSGGG